MKKIINKKIILFLTSTTFLLSGCFADKSENANPGPNMDNRPSVTLTDPANILDKNKIKEFFQSKEFRKELLYIGVYWDREILSLQKQCKSKYQTTPISFAFLKPIKFNSESIYPTEGVWTTRFKFTRCNESMIYNVISSAQNGQKPRTNILVRGTRRTSPLLMKDLYPSLLISLAIKGKNHNCKNINILDTEVTKEPFTLISDKKTFNGAWEELWQVSNCGEIVNMKFCFLPDGNGGTFFRNGTCKK